MTDKRPICGQTFNDGTCVNRWVEDADGNLLRRCECGYRDITGAEAREEGTAATVDANPDAMRAALAIIREAALANPTMSSNTVRGRMKLAQVPGPVVGAAFGQAVKDKVLRPIGYVSSTDIGTHLHPVREYESRLFRAGRVVA